MVSVPGANALLSFGGYNGKYHNSVHLYRPGAPPGVHCLIRGSARGSVLSVVLHLLTPWSTSSQLLVRHVTSGTQADTSACYM